MRREHQETYTQWRISLPGGGWKKIAPPDPHNPRGGTHEIARFRADALSLGIDYEPVVQYRMVRRVTVTLTTTTDTAGQWVGGAS